DGDERTPTVAEFLAELGVTGQEELPRSARSQAPQVTPTPSSPPPRYATAASAARAAPTVLKANDVDVPTLRSPVRTRRARAARKPRRRRSGSWLFLLPVVLVAGLAVAVLRD